MPHRLAHETAPVGGEVVRDDLPADIERDPVRLRVIFDALPSFEFEYEHFVPSIAASPKNDDLGEVSDRGTERMSDRGELRGHRKWNQGKP